VEYTQEILSGIERIESRERLDETRHKTKRAGCARNPPVAHGPAVKFSCVNSMHGRWVRAACSIPGTTVGEFFVKRYH
jgi:hypothetical protein